jgi:hypothetical protein
MGLQGAVPLIAWAAEYPDTTLYARRSRESEPGRFLGVRVRDAADPFPPVLKVQACRPQGREHMSRSRVIAQVAHRLR